MDTESRAAWQEVSELQKCSLYVLREEYQKLFGNATKSKNRQKLVEAIAKRMQEKPTNQTSDSALTSTFRPSRKRLTRKEKTAEKKRKSRVTRAVGSSDPRVPKAGSTIIKTYKGKTIHVRVKEKGFEYAGTEYRSLSAIAKKVTGSIWNGFLFFGLMKR